MEGPKVSKQAEELLDGKLARARSVIIGIMAAKESGSVTIGYGPQGLRLSFECNEKPQAVNPAPEEERLQMLKGYP